MKSIKYIAATFLMSFGSIASAGVFSDTEVINQYMYKGGPSADVHFDLTDDGFNPLFGGGPGFDIVYNARLDIWGGDDNLRDAILGDDHPALSFLGDGPEQVAGLASFFVFLPPQEVDGFLFTDQITYQWDLGGGFGDLFLLADIFIDGTLDVKLFSKHGDFFLHAARLSVNVPEPTSIALLAVGLIGLGLGARRRRIAASLT